MSADYWELVGPSPPGGVEMVVNESAHIDVQLDQRHLMLRGETVSGGWAETQTMSLNVRVWTYATCGTIRINRNLPEV